MDRSWERTSPSTKIPSSREATIPPRTAVAHDQSSDHAGPLPRPAPLAGTKPRSDRARNHRPHLLPPALPPKHQQTRRQDAATAAPPAIPAAASRKGHDAQIWLLATADRDHPTTRLGHPDDTGPSQPPAVDRRCTPPPDLTDRRVPPRSRHTQRGGKEKNGGRPGRGPAASLTGARPASPAKPLRQRRDEKGRGQGPTAREGSRPPCRQRRATRRWFFFLVHE
nr:protein IQ-DOMAIN 14-like [Aegilops tauschii subsp. strangulata]